MMAHIAGNMAPPGGPEARAPGPAEAAAAVSLVIVQLCCDRDRDGTLRLLPLNLTCR
jgi:hypothetical protein